MARATTIGSTVPKPLVRKTNCAARSTPTPSALICCASRWTRGELNWRNLLVYCTAVCRPLADSPRKVKLVSATRPLTPVRSSSCASAPNLGADHRRVREGQQIESLLLFLVQQRPHDPRIQRAGDARIEVPRALISFQRRFERSFGAHDRQVRQTPDPVGIRDVRLQGADLDSAISAAVRAA